MERLNKPFVALLVAIVGLVVGGYVVATDPIPGPPLKVVSTYTVHGNASTIGGVYVITLECNAGDLVVSGGYRATYRGQLFYVVERDAFYGVIASEPYVLANGTQGWRITVVDDFPHQDLPDPTINPVVEASAVCLHRG